MSRTIKNGVRLVFLVMGVGGSLRAELPAPLTTVQAPGPDLVAMGILNSGADAQTALERLGKALFWDMQVGSDGIVACATCHFHAGGDHRRKNQVQAGIVAPLGFEIVTGANQDVNANDFPFFLAHPDTNDRVASQGVVACTFVDIVPGSSVDTGTSCGMIRQRAPRHAPSTDNALFNDRQRWDGLASFDFVTRRCVVNPDTSVTCASVTISNSSLASLAVGPANNNVLMAWGPAAGARSFPKLGKKMLSLQPLAKQLVASDDSLLGPCSASPAKGLTASPGCSGSYSKLIEDAFRTELWDSTLKCTGGDVTITCTAAGPAVGTSEFTLKEANFRLFWAMATQAYMRRLRSDQTPFDSFLAGNQSALSENQKNGMGIFFGKGGCTKCHSGPELTGNGVTTIAANGRVESVDGEPVDTGFQNHGVSDSNTNQDCGIGEVRNNGSCDPAAAGAPVHPSLADGPFTKGGFKAPGLRNVKFTGPYMHDGSLATVEQVVNFYARGGRFANTPERDPRSKDSISFGPDDTAALVDFLENALLDNRVSLEKGPFDHPEICVANGHTTPPTDDLRGIPAVGNNGGSNPLQTFQELLTGVTAGRAHNLLDPPACSP